MNYYERHLGDYAKDTAHLSMMEHGAYTLLLDRYYATEKGIPQDQVYRIARARTAAEKRAVDNVLREFFELCGVVWTKNRCEVEIQGARTRISSAQENGKLGGRPKSQQNQRNEKPNGLNPVPISEPSANPEETQHLTGSKALQSPISNLQSPEDSRRGEAPSVDQAIYADARKIFGSSIGGQIGKAIKAHGKPWILGVIEACRTKDQEQARAYLAAALNGVKKPDAAAQRKVFA
jgi:uncharacterized protein YdaU (DUF1376 family)